MNVYGLLPTPVLEFLRDFTQVIHNAGKPTYESRRDLRAIKMELHLRSAPLMQDFPLAAGPIEMGEPEEEE